MRTAFLLLVAISATACETGQTTEAKHAQAAEEFAGRLIAACGKRGTLAACTALETELNEEADRCDPEKSSYRTANTCDVLPHQLAAVRARLAGLQRNEVKDAPTVAAVPPAPPDGEDTGEAAARDLDIKRLVTSDLDGGAATAQGPTVGATGQIAQAACIAGHRARPDMGPGWQETCTAGQPRKELDIVQITENPYNSGGRCGPGARNALLRLIPCK